MIGEEFWLMDEARKEYDRQNKLTLKDAASYLASMWEICLEEKPGLPKKLPEGLVDAINDVVACAV